MQQITEILHADFIPFNKSFSADDLSRYLKETFQKQLDFKSYDKLIMRAFTHKSFVHEMKSDLLDNERLEFLGDSVLQLTITEKLFKELSGESEGTLSKMRSSLVNEKTLSRIARMLDFNKLILLGKGELKEGGANKDSILANSYEAYLGACFLISSLSEVKSLILNHFDCLAKKDKLNYFDPSILAEFDPKTRLQEICHKAFGKTPEYIVKESVDGGFEITCKVAGQVLGTQSGTSKKQVMQELAKNIIKNNTLKENLNALN